MARLFVAVPLPDDVRADLETFLEPRIVAGYVGGGTRRNLDWVRPHLDARVEEDDLLLLADAQTSGGLLVIGEVLGAPVIGEVVTTGDACTISVR